MKIDIGERLKELRKFHGLSQGELALLLRVHPMTISKWERGHSPSLSVWQRLEPWVMTLEAVERSLWWPLGAALRQEDPIAAWRLVFKEAHV